MGTLEMTVGSGTEWWKSSHRGGQFGSASSIHLVFAADYIPSEQILLNCGESSILNDTDTQSWTPDVGSKFLLSTKSSTSKATTQDPLVPKVPYMTARLSQSEFSYRFPIVPSLDGETLTIKFTPSTNSSNAYAFVNGIEVISMPDIYSNDNGLKLVGQDSLIFVDNTTALESVYRINVGGNDISPSGDTGLFRSWYNDQPYLYGETVGVTVTADPSKTIISYPKDMPTYVAPENVYSTARSMRTNPQINKNYNLTWIFTIN
ncbi:hypothetical protein LWI29_015341 [Acer saccharum]|uniref:Uncharacterized protein n=1 Tax=Acer saccharum TaxID=4024 RepID=A0AA39S5D3_ACESA|nr:hypothetical protein LWI29_015341 [Acer saccharum]